MISDTTLISFYHDNGKYKIEICDIENTSRERYVKKTFEYESDIPADKGDLVINENSVFVSPHNKQLNLIDGEWYLNDFVSTTPLVSIVDEDSVDLNVGAIKARGFIQVVDQPNIPVFINLGRYKITIGEREFITDSIFNSDSKEAIALKIFNALSLSNFDITLTETTRLKEYKKRVFQDSGFIYNIEDLEVAYIVLGDQGFSLINIQAEDFGSFFNNKVTIEAIEGNQSSRELLESYVVSTDIFGGTDIDFLNQTLGTLEQQTDYYYKVRYVYSDGHITKTNFPVYFRTNNLKRLCILDIDIEKDLDGSSFVALEIFRKREGGVFQLIRRINNTQDSFRIGNKFVFRFVDTGFIATQPLDEREYVWTKEHKTQTIARDRYLRANVKYADRAIQASGRIDIQDTEGEQVIPFNTISEVYVKGRFKDGLESLYTPIDKFSFRPVDILKGLDKKLSVDVDTNFQNLKELGIYVKYENILQSRFTIPFNSIEFYNQNIASTASANQDIEDKPANPHVLYGWRYVRYDQTLDKYQIFDSEWDRNPKAKEEPDNFKDFWFEANDVTVVESRLDGTPSIIDVNTSSFVRRYKIISSGLGGILYELADLEQLKRASRNNKLVLRNVGGLINAPENLVNAEVNAFVFDKSEDFGTEALDQSYPPRSNRVYFVLPSDSEFSNVTFFSFTDNGYDSNFPQVSPAAFSSLNFELLDLTLQRNDNGVGIFGTFVDNPYTLVSTRNVEVTEGIFYVGKITDPTLTNDVRLRTAYRKVEEDNFLYWVPVESRIVEQLVTEDDIATFTFDYPNQIIWSDAYVRGSKINGLRSFNFINFLNLSTEYGEIKKIVYLNNQVVVFCPRGVAVVSVGEVLTQTASGQTFVDTTRFLNSERWLLKNIPNIQTNSIRQYENMLFFSDGVDVWMLSDSLSNISQGAIKLNLSDDSAVATIDVKHKEYRISDDVHTFAFNFEVQEWFGPYTYKDKYSTTYKDETYATVENRLTIHNKSNRFGDKEYETIVSSVANEEGEASVNKLFRKFYLEVDGLSKFFYGKNLTNKKEVDIETKRKINNIYQIGVDAENKNANRLFWTIKSKANDFTLKLVSFIWTPRNRR